ncbi:MAG TPA: helix-turn-helix transcriptional regulator [Gaiellaceae bacterium]|nr:helix-turn-helix transcriptional regulator [Gaiellaceae bacterium]
MTLDEIEHLPRPQGRALEVALLRAEPEGRPPDTRTLGTALRGLLREHATSTPVLVAIDDAHFAVAASIADEGVAVAQLTGSASQYAHVRAQRAWVDAHLGDVEATRRGCVEAAAAIERAGWAVPGLWVAAALGLLELSLGNDEAAWASCEGPTVVFERLGITTPGPVFFLPSALEALVAIGDLHRAEPLIAALEACGERLDDAWARATSGRCRALLLAARGDLVAAAGVLELALAEHQRLLMPFERARTLVVAGIVERRARRWGRARALLEEAAAEFERMGARLWAERARHELARVSGRRASGDALTPSERRVAELAAEGLSNKEIAQALFVTVDTVERHLSHAYGKLGIHSRAQLAPHLPPVE